MTRDQGPDRGFLLESWLEFHDAVESHPELRRLLFDPVTGLPTTPLLFPRIQVLLEERGEVSLLCLNVVKYSKIEEIYGWRVFDDVMRMTSQALEAITGRELRDSDIVAELMISGNSFVIVLSPPRSKTNMDISDLDMIARRVEGTISSMLEEQLEAALFKKFGCYAGYSVVKHDDRVRLERLVHEGLDSALELSRGREVEDAATRVAELRGIIDRGEIHTLVHPVFDLKDMTVIGYEALSRGPEGGEFERPDKLFAIAYDADLVMKLERLCRKSALAVAKDMPDGRLLFLNVEPDAVVDPELRDVMFTTLLTEVGLEPARIVLELTERSAIADFRAFRATLEYLRAVGFAVAVDDAGAGYGSLQCLAEVRPEWLKVDISLVRGIDADEVRRQLVSSLVTFARRMEVKLVAEGIETAEELAALRELGVEYGQGYLFSVPVTPFQPDPDLRHLLP